MATFKKESDMQTNKVTVEFTTKEMSEEDVIALISHLLADGLIHNDGLAEEGTTIERVENVTDYGFGSK